MAGIFGNNQDDEFDLVEGREDREADSGTAPALPRKVPPPQRPAPRQAAPAVTPTRFPQQAPAAAPAVRPAAQRPAAPTPAPAREEAPRPAPAPQRRPVPAPVPAPVPEPEPEQYEEEAYAEQYEDYAPEPEVPAYSAPTRRAEPEYSPEAEELFAPPAPKVEPQREAPVAAAAAAKKAPKKQAGGWGAILGIGASKEAKPEQDAGEKPRSRWAGRKKSLVIQAVLILLVLIVGYNGLLKMFGPSEGPTYAQVQDAARAAVGSTGFPVEEGGAVALGFAKTFFAYDPSSTAQDLRDSQLLQYVNEDGLNSLDANYPTDGTQAILDGPYLTSLNSLDAQHAIATVSMTLRGAAVENSDQATTKVIFVSFPLSYNAGTNTISVSGSPTFVPPTNVGGVDETYTAPGWEADSDVASAINENLLSQFFTAWGQSNTANLNSLLAGTKETTLRAKTGLHGAVSFVPDSISNTIVESAGTGQSTTAHRRFQTTVTWQNDVTKAQYGQTYRGWIVRQSSGSWTIEDINNAAEFSTGAEAAN